MPAFPKPTFAYTYQVASQIQALRDWRDNEPGRKVPDKKSNRLLVATWNIANLGVQQRRASDYKLIAEMITWFDLVTVQEVNERLDGLRGIQEELPSNWRMLFSDVAGNNERIAFFYDSDKVEQLELVGEVGVPPKDYPKIKIAGIGSKFDGFDRNPYLAAFKAKSFSFTLVSVHLYFGKDKPPDIERRSLETLAVARWADLERKSPSVYCEDIIVLGDFNLPKPADNPVYKALVGKGLKLPPHTSEIGSSTASDNHYDQIAFLPGDTFNDWTGEMNVFDFDGALFRTLWDTHTKAQFNAYIRYYISDHRPLWAEFKI
jgi:endonuclease/exonuclease/phosphatase family metal-dependent hydrolase